MAVIRHPAGSRCLPIEYIQGYSQRLLVYSERWRSYRSVCCPEISRMSSAGLGTESLYTYVASIIKFIAFGRVSLTAVLVQTQDCIHGLRHVYAVCGMDKRNRGYKTFNDQRTSPSNPAQGLMHTCNTAPQRLSHTTVVIRIRGNVRNSSAALMYPATCDRIDNKRLGLPNAQGTNAAQNRSVCHTE